MITEETLNQWLSKLEETKHLLEAGETPSSLWFNELDWLIWDGRRDIESGDFDIPGFVSQEEVDKLNNELDSYEEETYSLDEECASLESDVDRLEMENNKLKKKLEEIHGLSDRNG